MFPIVRFIFACDVAVYDLASGKWGITNPWHTVRMPKGITKGHGQEELWLYAQLADGLGEFELGVELRYFEPTKSSGLVLGRSQVERRVFSHKLEVHEFVFKMSRVPFPRIGQYDFRLTCRGEPLENGIAFLDVLPGREK